MAKSKDGKPANVAPRKATMPKAGPKSHGGGRNQGNNGPQQQIRVTNPNMAFGTGKGRGPSIQDIVLEEHARIIIDMLIEANDTNIRSGVEKILATYLALKAKKGRLVAAVEKYRTQHPNSYQLKAITFVARKAIWSAQQIAYYSASVDDIYTQVWTEHQQYLEQRQKAKAPSHQKELAPTA
jgi:hypothetical protein